MTVPKQWIRTVADERAARAGYRFDASKGEYAIGFLEQFCRHYQGPSAGQTLVMLPWQRDFLMRLYSWLEPDRDVRRFRRSYLEIAKKNGKSTLFSGLGLYHTIADAERGPEVLAAASDRQQASIIFDTAVAMVRQDDYLYQILEIVNSRKTIVSKANDGRFRALSSEVGPKDGANASTVLFDELHRQPNDRLWNVLKYAGRARTQPLTLGITTAGEMHSGLWFDQRDYAEKVNDGRIDDPTYLGVVYRAEETDDLEDPAVWRKANPSLGVTFSERDFKADLTEALSKGGAAWAEFMRLSLNIVAAAEGRFLSEATWDSCNAHPSGDRPGARVWGGLDIGSRRDLTALVWLFADGSIRCRFWTCSKNIVEREQQDRSSYRAWARDGFLEIHDGDTIDYERIQRQIIDDSKEYDVAWLFVDSHQAEYFGQQLLNHYGLPVKFIRQGFHDQAEPTKELEALALDGRLKHGGHPVMRWCAGNAVAERNVEGNMRLTKARSTGRIDGMSALVSAIAARMADQSAESEDSVYNTQELLLI